MAEINTYIHDQWNVTCITNGTWKQNCYVIKNINSNNCLLIDPGSEGEEIISFIENNDLVPMAIYNTHGHYDHIGAVHDLKLKYDIKFFVHSGDKKIIKHGNLYRIIFDDTKMIKIPKIDYLLESENNSLIPSEWKFECLYTPGHTEGSCCFIFDGVLFTGDTLLKDGTGRTDLPGGDDEIIKESVKILRNIKADKYVFPGHGKPFYLKQVINNI